MHLEVNFRGHCTQLAPREHVLALPPGDVSELCKEALHLCCLAARAAAGACRYANAGGRGRVVRHTSKRDNI